MDFAYDPVLVTLSIAVAMLGAFTGLVMTAGIRTIGGLEAGLRIGLGGVAIGGGIWAMHFIAVLALRLPVNPDYMLIWTLLSALLVIFAAGLSLMIGARRLLGRYSLFTGAVLFGSAVSAMHHIGLSAVYRDAVMAYSWSDIAISTLFAVQAAAIALWFAFRERGLIDTFLGSVALGLVISSMQYIAMETTSFAPADGVRQAPGGTVSNDRLALTVAIATYGLCGVSIVVFAVLTYVRRALQRRYLQAMRMARSRLIFSP